MEVAELSIFKDLLFRNTRLTEVTVIYNYFIFDYQCHYQSKLTLLEIKSVNGVLLFSPLFTMVDEAFSTYCWALGSTISL